MSKRRAFIRSHLIEDLEIAMISCLYYQREIEIEIEGYQTEDAVPEELLQRYCKARIQVKAFESEIRKYRHGY